MSRRDDESPGRDLPWWVRTIALVGVPGFIALGLLGMIPGVSSPFIRIEQAMAVIANTMREHDQTARATLHINQLVCRGIWRDNPEVQRQCGRNESPP